LSRIAQDKYDNKARELKDRQAEFGAWIEHHQTKGCGDWNA